MNERLRIPDANANIFVQQAFAQPAECSECSASLVMEECLPPMWVVRITEEDDVYTCLEPMEIDTSREFVPISETCEQAPEPEWVPDGMRARGVIEARPPEAPAQCQLDAVEQTVPEATFPGYFRICDALPLPEESCGGDGQCFALENADDSVYQPYACIEHAGDVECPEGPYAEKTLLFGSANDARECTECIVEHEAGEILCDATLFIADWKSEETSPCQKPRVTEPNAVCHGKILDNFSGRIAAYFEDMVQNYSGDCGATGGQSAGSYTLEEPVTLCCTPK